MFPGSHHKYVGSRLGEGEVTLADYESTFKKLSWKATINLSDYIKTQIGDLYAINK